MAWERARFRGLETQIDSAKPNEIHITPNRLFHYKTFKEEHLVSLLLEGKLKLSRPNQFNDPWDCRVHYHVPTDPKG